VTNNIILKKLRVAFELKEDDLHAVLKAVKFPVSKPELSALFRKVGHTTTALAATSCCATSSRASPCALAEPTHRLAHRLRALLLQGEVRHPAPAATGACRAGVLELVAPFDQGDAVQGLEQVSHVWLLFLFHKPWKTSHA
jgi:hypothetical protein